MAVTRRSQSDRNVVIEVTTVKQPKARNAVVRYGAVKVANSAPDAELRKSNIAAGKKAMQGARSALLKSGVRLRHGKSVPLYYVDAKHPQVLIRELDGRRERGRLVNGSFVPAE